MLTVPLNETVNPLSKKVKKPETSIPKGYMTGEQFKQSVLSKLEKFYQENGLL